MTLSADVRVQRGMLHVELDVRVEDGEGDLVVKLPADRAAELLGTVSLG